MHDPLIWHGKTETPTPFAALLCVRCLALVSQRCDQDVLFNLLKELRIQNLSSARLVLLIGLNFMSTLQAGEAPQPVRYEDSRLAGVRRLEAGSGRFPGMHVFPHSGAITGQATLLLFLSPFCLYCGLPVLTSAEQREDEHNWGKFDNGRNPFWKKLCCPRQGLS